MIRESGAREDRVTYLGEDLLWKSLGDLENVGFDASLCKTSLLSLGESLDVAIHRVLWKKESVTC